MKFQILHESPGRVRLRTVRPFMSMEQADLLEAYLTALDVDTGQKLCYNANRS